MTWKPDMFGKTAMGGAGPIPPMPDPAPPKLIRDQDTSAVNKLVAKYAEPEHFVLTFDALSEANKARQQEWDGGHALTEEYLGNALAGEVGEACNVVKKLARQRMGLSGSRASAADLGAELADVIIYADLLAAHYNIDLNETIRAKFNATTDKLGFKTRL